jgi:hypothetical protein
MLSSKVVRVSTNKLVYAYVTASLITFELNDLCLWNMV